MDKFKLVSKYKPTGSQPEAIRQVFDSVKKNNRYQTLLGVTGVGKTFIMANIIEKMNKSALVIAPNKTLAAQLYREYKNFFPQNKVCFFVSYYDYYQPEAYLPVSDTYIEKEAMINEEIDRLRHLATSALLIRKDVIVVASVSCIYNLGLPEKYFSSTIGLSVGQPITRGDLMRELIKVQFSRNNISPKRGQFRLRGDVFEIVPASEEIIYQIILKDQKIFSINIVDKLTRKIKEELKDLIIFPPKHFVSTAPEREMAIKNIKNELKERLKYFEENKLFLEAERLERRTKYDLEMMNSIGYCHGIENYSRHLAGKLPGEPPETLLSYFGKPEDFLIIIDESHIAVPQIRGMYKGDKSRKGVLIEHGWRLPSALDNRPLKFKEFEERIGQVIFTSATPGDFEIQNSSEIVEAVIRPTGLIDPEVVVKPIFDPSPFKDKNNILKYTKHKSSKGEGYSQIDDFINEVKKVIENGERALAITLTKRMAEELSEFLRKNKIKAEYLHSDIKTLERAEILTNFRKGKFDVLVGINLLREGLDLPEVALVAIFDADKEGFLRSGTSLIQTIGRAARNIRGKVILYADNLTGSINKAVSETNRRRKIQLEYNKKHKITPKTIKKDIEEFI